MKRTGREPRRKISKQVYIRTPGEQLRCARPAKKLRVAVLYGGRSGEHEISLCSAESIIAARDSVACYQAVHCEGMARVDFLLETATGKFYINEPNTIPGFTSIGMYPKMWEAAGLPYAKLIDRLIQLERDAERKATRFSM